MRDYEHAYAGLILPDETGLDPEPYLDACQQVLARLDPRPVGVPKRSAKRQAVLGHYYGLRVRPDPDSDFGPRVVLDVITRDGALPDEKTASRLLSDAVLASLRTSQADIVEWFAPDTLLDANDFIRLRSYVSPRRMPEQQAGGLDRSTMDAVHAMLEAEERLFETDAALASHSDQPRAETPTADPAQPDAPMAQKGEMQDLRQCLSDPDDADADTRPRVSRNRVRKTEAGEASEASAQRFDLRSRLKRLAPRANPHRAARLFSVAALYVVLVQTDALTMVIHQFMP